MRRSASGGDKVSVRSSSRPTTRFLNQHLHSLGGPRREFAAASSETVPCRRDAASMLAAATAPWIARLIPTPADRRHRMRCIADAEQSWPMPDLEPVDRDRQQFDVVPGGDFAGAVAQVGCTARDLVAKRRQAAAANLVEAALGNDKRALPIVAAIEQHQDPPSVEAER
jgi:hypothetical protein